MKGCVFRFSFCALLLAASLFGHADAKPGASNKAQQAHMEVELIAERNPSGDLGSRVGVLFKPDPGWHIYWRNPGDSGIAPVINWQGAAEVGELHWPFPESIPIAHLVNLGYHHETLLWAEYSSAMPTELVAELDWLVCEQACIPGSAKLSLNTADITPQDDQRAATQFNRWQAKLPVPLPVMDASATIDNDTLTLQVYAKKPLFSTRSKVEVFIQNLDLVIYGDPKSQRAINNVLMWKQQLSEFKAVDPKFVEAVIVIDQTTAYSLAIPVKKV